MIPVKDHKNLYRDEKSGAIINTETGSMKGSYGMINDQGQRFEAVIPEFSLSEPYTLH